MITVEFKIKTVENAPQQTCLVSMPTVPFFGELVELRGKNYKVRDRGWIIDQSYETDNRAKAWVTLMPWFVE
jgi:hypothetical protein